MNDRDWTGPYCGVTHRVKANIQYTVESWNSFSTGFIYSWRVCKCIEEDLTWHGENHIADAKAYMESREKLYS